MIVLKSSVKLEYIVRTLVALLYIFVLGSVSAQVDSINHHQSARQNFTENSITVAISDIELASSIFSTSQDWDSIYACQMTLFRNRDRFNDLNILYGHLANLDILMPDSRDIHARGKSQYLLAYVQSKIGNVDKTIHHYSRALDILEYVKDTVRHSGVLANLADEYVKLGNYNAAIGYKRKSIELAKSDTGNRVNYIRHLRGLADAYYYQGDSKKSKEYCLEILNLLDRTDSSTSFTLAAIENDLGNFKEALRLNNEAKDSAQDDGLWMATIKQQQAGIYARMGNLQKAIAIYQTIQATMLGQSDKRQRGKFLYAFGKYYAQDNKFDLALDYYNRALISFCGISLNEVNTINTKTYIFNEIWLGEIFASLRELYFEAYKKNSSEEDLLKAQQYLELALYALDQKRILMYELESTHNFTEKVKGIYESALKMNIELFEKGRNVEYLYNSFSITEKYNAFVLRQQLREKSVLDIVQATLEEKEKYFKKKYNYHHSAIQLGSSYSDSLFTIFSQSKDEYFDYIKVLSVKYDKFDELCRDQQSIDVFKIQDKLDSESAVVKYFIGKESIYIFIITESSIDYQLIDLEDEFTSDLLKYRDLLSTYYSQREDSLRSVFIDLSNKIFVGVAQPFVDVLSDEITKLTIIPTGPLVFIPFESLIVRMDDNWSNPNSYLLSKYNISYAYFSGQLVSVPDTQEVSDVSTYGLEYDDFTIKFMKDSFNKNKANPNNQKLRHSSFTPLYFADDEAMEVAGIMDGNYFVNENATKGNFLKNGINSDIIHISAHSFIDSEFPENSCIIFNKQDSISDNLLKLNDIYNLDIKAQLVTLSACNTLYGKEIPGEGLTSMARAFTNAGASSVVGSLWSVPDEISNILMQLFYKNLKAGYSKSEALRQAKIEFLTNDNICNPFYRTPAYWSSWVIYGDDDPIIMSSQTDFSKWSIAVLSFLGVLFLYIFIQKTKFFS